MFRLGVTGFLLASLACALAPSAAALIGLRAIQGATAAMIIPQTIGLIRAMFGGNEMARALGCIGPVMGLAAVTGPVLGGVLTHANVLGLSWRAVFLVNVPIAAAVLMIAPRLAEDRAPQRPSLDLAGTAAVVLGTGLIVYPLIGAAPSRRPGSAWTEIALGLIILIGFGGHLRRATRAGRRPLVELSLFTSRVFPAALVTSTLFFAVMSGLTLAVVLYLQLGLGFTALTAGLSLLPMSAASSVASWTAGAYLIPRYGARIMLAGLVVLLAGVLAAIAVLAGTGPAVYPRSLPVVLGVAGLGVGVFTTPFFTAALRPVSPQETGSAAGLLNAVQQLGATLGVAILGSIYLAGARPGSPATAVHGLQHVFWVSAGLLVAAGLTAAVMTARRL
jgi:MFS family permease